MRDFPTKKEKWNKKTKRGKNKAKPFQNKSKEEQMENAFEKQGMAADCLKGTKTERNLHTALSGESQAYLRYKWFENKARQDGFEEIARIFCETADNEKEHAEIWFRYLGGWSSTEENLKKAAEGEHFEWTSMYAQFAKEAKEEGFDALARLFEKVGDIEKRHEARYEQYRNTLKTGDVFSSNDAQSKWICLNCGHVAIGKEPPMICPVCQHSQGYFKKQENH